MKQHGNVWHVSQNGTGNFLRIQDAVDVMKPGDMTVIHSGIYREEVVIPHGGTDESSRIILKAAPDEEVIITGADPIEHGRWEKDPETGLYFLQIEKDSFKKNAEGEYFNPFAENWMSKGLDYKGFFSCGCIYWGDRALDQLWSAEDVAETPLSWYAQVEKGNETTTVYVNWGEVNPNDKKNQIEMNVRMQCITSRWNQGFITIDGIKVMRGCGPKTIDFWMTNAEAMYGAIAVNGGHHWIIENCEVTQCRGVAVDFGNGSAKQELRYGGEPELYGYHIIRKNCIHHNGTNGLMAYRGAYTEIYENTIYNNNALNTNLRSEGYIKDVSGGWGIYIHDNYLYSDQEWASYPLWMDSECDMCRFSRNIVYCRGNGKGFSALDYECNSGWNMIDNNIFVGVGYQLNASTSTYFINNLWLGIHEWYRTWPSSNNTRCPGTEGFDGYTRTMRIVEPGTLKTIGKNKTSRWQTFNNNCKMLGNLFFGRGLTTLPSDKILGAKRISGSGAVVEAEKAVNGIYGEMVLDTATDDRTGERRSNPDYSGGTWHSYLPTATLEEKKMDSRYQGIYAWVPATEDDRRLFEKQMAGMDPRAAYGNECDYNGYLNGAKKIDHPDYAAARGYTADSNSFEREQGRYEVEATPETFVLRIDYENVSSVMDMPVITGAMQGASPCYVQAAGRYLDKEVQERLMPEDVSVDFFGKERMYPYTKMGPFQEIRDLYVCWPKS